MPILTFEQNDRIFVWNVELCEYYGILTLMAVKSRQCQNGKVRV